MRWSTAPPSRSYLTNGDTVHIMHSISIPLVPAVKARRSSCPRNGWTFASAPVKTTTLLTSTALTGGRLLLTSAHDPGRLLCTPAGLLTPTTSHDSRRPWRSAFQLRLRHSSSLLAQRYQLNALPTGLHSGHRIRAAPPLSSQGHSAGYALRRQCQAASSAIHPPAQHPLPQTAVAACRVRWLCRFR